MDLKATYNKIAEAWFADHHDDDWWHEGTEKFLSLLPKGATILDVGCNAGVKSRYLTKKGFKVTGVDFSDKAIDIAKRESPEIEYEVVDMYELDSYPKTFDAVFAQAVLLHVPKNRVLEVLKKFTSRLHKGGFLYVAVKGVKKDQPEEEIKKENDYGYEYERFFSYFTLPELEKDFADVGIKVVWKNSKVSGHTEWLQIIGKAV